MSFDVEATYKEAWDYAMQVNTNTYHWMYNQQEVATTFGTWYVGLCVRNDPHTLTVADAWTEFASSVLMKD